MKKFLIVDGNSIMNRAFYGIKLLTNSEGLYTNAVYGFLNILFKNMDAINPDYVAVAFDLKAPTFRHKRYAEYKAQRKGMPEELFVQMPVIKEVLSAMNITILEKEGYEADDIIGTMAKRCHDEGIECDILTGDKDDLQLASDNTSVLLTTTRMGQTTTDAFDDKAVFEKYGVTPEEFISVKALMGDTSDNIPGVKGIGEKTAFELIKNFHTLENLYDDINSDIIKKSAREKLTAGKEDAFLCRTLCTIDRSVPINFNLEDALRCEADNDTLSKKLAQLELKKIAERLCAEAQPAIKEAPLCEKATAQIIHALNTENEFSFILSGGNVEFCHNSKPYFCSIDDIKDIFENPNIKKITHGYKKTRRELEDAKIMLCGDFYDTEIAAYIIDPARTEYTLGELFTEFSLPLSAAFLPLLVQKQLEIIEEREQFDLLEEIEFPLENVLYDMESAGFEIDKSELSAFSKMLGERINALESSIYFMAGEQININSPKQLGKLLFEDLALPVVKKTKTGYSTDSAVLEKLRGKHEIIDLIIEYRHLSKLKSTYADAFLPLLDDDSRIHSTLKQTVTATGRISSAEPNLQNIPVRTEIGREIRKMFVAKEGFLLVGADYSQIELRVLAHMSGDKTMQDAFINDEDIHTITASQVFNVPPFLVNDTMRSRAKTVNFGIIYGQSEFSLSQELKISRKEAKEYIENYFNNYSNVKEYMERTIQDAKECGYVSTVFKRRRYIPELAASNFNLRSFGERVAMNAPIQGTAADIIKIAMVKVYDSLREKCPSARLILQVHDELICEVPKEKADIAAQILKGEMENAVSLSVPLKADVKVGKSWYETK